METDKVELEAEEFRQTKVIIPDPSSLEAAVKEFIGDKGHDRNPN